MERSLFFLHRVFLCIKGKKQKQKQKNRKKTVEKNLALCLKISSTEILSLEFRKIMETVAAQHCSGLDVLFLFVH